MQVMLLIYIKKMLSDFMVFLRVLCLIGIQFLSYFWKTLWRLVGTKLLFNTSHYPQTDGKTEVTNRTLSTLLRGLVSKTAKDWDIKHDHAEFAYNRTPSSTTGISLSEVVYGVNPYIPIDLIPLLKADILNYKAKARQEAFKKTCDQVKKQIEKMNEMYKQHANRNRRQPEFQPGDLVWLNLRKERFSAKRKNKLLPRTDGPFKVLERYCDSAYKIDLPSEYGGVSATFNVGDLAPYLDDANLWAIFFSEGENEPDVDTSQTMVTRSGPLFHVLDSYDAKSYKPMGMMLDTLGCELVSNDNDRSSFLSYVTWVTDT